MNSRTSRLVALAAALAGCGGQRAPGPRHLPASVATVPTNAALLRISRTNGAVELLQASTLSPREWLISSGLPAIARLLGASAETRTVYGADESGRLVSIDLVARKSRVQAGSPRQLSATPDGTIIGLDSARHPTRFINGGMVTFPTVVDRGAVLLRGPGDAIVALSGKPTVLQVLNTEGEARRFAVPAGRIATTWSGDLVAIATDTAIVFIDPSKTPAPAKRRSRTAAAVVSVRMRGTPIVSTFSPSGHRLYVARKKGDIVMLDRFARTELDHLQLPGTADRLRVDRTGQWLLAHSATGDSLWVIDLSRWTRITTLLTPWDDDLPQVVDGHTLLTRNRADLVATDLAAGTAPPQRSVLVGGGADLYIMLPWVPKPTPIAVAPPGQPDAGVSASNGSPGATRPPAAAADTITPAVVNPLPAPVHITPPESVSAATAVYLQVSSSQNQEWAKAFAQQLKDGGFPAKVLDPKNTDEGYRVVIGPYASRTEAEAAGKKLGRSYFIITPGPGNT